jgi:hypothetical protein
MVRVKDGNFRRSGFRADQAAALSANATFEELAMGASQLGS